MGPLIQTARKLVERLTGFHVHRGALPHGSRLYDDLARVSNWGPPSVIFDIGAHQGLNARRFREVYPQATIHAFEPASSNLQKLKAAFAADPSIHVHPLALGSKVGTADLHLTDNSTTHSLVHTEASSKTETVQVATLDDVCRNVGVERIGYCKIDTEGGDLEVLQGSERMLAEQRIDFVQVETSIRHDTSYFAPLWDMDALLTRHKYEVFGFYDQQPCWTGRSSLLFFNAVYVRSSLVDHLPVGWG